jgi:hypothetical protein
VTHIAVLAAASPFTAAWIAVNHMFKDVLDVLWNRAMVQNTVGASFYAVSFELILIAEFSLLGNSSVVGLPVFARRWWQPNVQSVSGAVDRDVIGLLLCGQSKGRMLAGLYSLSSTSII